MTDSISSSSEAKAPTAHPDHKQPKGSFFSRKKHSPNDANPNEKGVEVSTNVNSQENVTKPASLFQLFRCLSHNAYLVTFVFSTFFFEAFLPSLNFSSISSDLLRLLLLELHKYVFDSNMLDHAVNSFLASHVAALR